MEASIRKGWLLSASLIGALYFLIGVAFSAFARWDASIATQETWNRLAFLLSGILFLIHLGHEHFRFRHSARIDEVETFLACAKAEAGN